MPHAAAKKSRRRPSDRYLLSLDDDEVEQLRDSICPESVAQKCWQMLRWQREGQRNKARDAARRVS
jgi:hypothetical protein